MRVQYFVLVLLAMILISCSANQSGKNKNISDLLNNKESSEDTGSINTNTTKQSSECRTAGARSIPREPITQEYFDGFLNSSEQFSRYYFYFKMGSDPDHPDARRQFFRIHSPAELDIQNGIALGSLLSNIPNCAAYYDDLDSNDSFMLDLSDVIITPIFNLMQQQSDYYFNAEEYGGEEMLEMAMEYSFGHWNHIALRIEPPDTPMYTVVPVKTLCKGWDPGDDPPAELMPLITYLENVIFPEMRQHPYP